MGPFYSCLKLPLYSEDSKRDINLSSVNLYRMFILIDEKVTWPSFLRKSICFIFLKPRMAFTSTITVCCIAHSFCSLMFPSAFISDPLIHPVFIEHLPYGRHREYTFEPDIYGACSLIFYRLKKGVVQ